MWGARCYSCYDAIREIADDGTSGVTCRANTQTKAPPSSSDGAEIFQFKMWLMGLSPMVWRRIEVPASVTLRELHGVLQVVMGWEGIHLFQFNLRAIRFGSIELCTQSPNISLEALQLRQGSRFIYEYDLNVPWRHELRLEARVQPKSGRFYPRCVAGHEACPPEDCGGIARFLEQRNAWCSGEALDELARLAEFIDEAVLKERRELFDDAELIEEMREVARCANVRQSWRGAPFSCKAVNARLKKGDHLVLTHQQG